VNALTVGALLVVIAGASFWLRHLRDVPGDDNGGLEIDPAALDLASPSPEERTQPVREFSLRVVPLVRTALPGQPGWQLHGRVRAAFRFSSPALDFGDLIRGAAMPTRTVDVQCHVPVKQVAAEYDKSLVEIRVIPVEGPTDGYRLAGTSRPGLPPGVFTLRAGLGGIGPDGGKIPPLPLLIRGRIVDDVRAIPEVLTLGAVSPGQTAEETVTLCSRSGSTFEVVSVVQEGDDLILSPTSKGGIDGEAGGLHYRVVLRRAKPGSHTVAVRFVVRQASRDQTAEIPLLVSYFGISNPQEPAVP
jgi:hypothetical protein